MARKVYKTIFEGKGVYLELTGNLDKIIDDLQTLRDDFRNRGIEGDLIFESDHFCYECSGENTDYIVRYARKETEAERNDRLDKMRKSREKTKRAKEAKEAKEVELLKQLINKHGIPE
jgi:hypothetical protein